MLVEKTWTSDLLFPVNPSKLEDKDVFVKLPVNQPQAIALLLTSLTWEASNSISDAGNTIPTAYLCTQNMLWMVLKIISCDLDDFGQSDITYSSNCLIPHNTNVLFHNEKNHKNKKTSVTATWPTRWPTEYS